MTALFGGRSLRAPGRNILCAETQRVSLGLMHLLTHAHSFLSTKVHETAVVLFLFSLPGKKFVNVFKINFLFFLC